MDQLGNQIPTRQIEAWMDTAVTLGMQYAPKLLLALIVLFGGMWIVNRVVRGVSYGLEKRAVEPTLARFLTSLGNVVLKALLLISVASMIGIETTSFVAMLGAGGLAIGLALQGSLANFAGGVLVLMFRPYKVGDYIEAQGVAGTVKQIEIFNTIINTPDNKTIIVPNGSISNGIITNYSRENTRRIDFVFGVSYNAAIAATREALQGVIAAEPRVLQDPAPVIVVSALGDSAVNFTVRVWVNSADYWGVYFEVMERAKLALDAAGIGIPFPQRDVHVFQHAS